METNTAQTETVVLRFGAHHNPPRLDRYIGVCRGCGAGAQIVGFLASVPRAGFVLVVDGDRYIPCGDCGSNATTVYSDCSCDSKHRVVLRRVTDTHKGRKPRHECNAKCLASTGPACECKCGGQNHGKSLRFI